MSNLSRIFKNLTFATGDKVKQSDSTHPFTIESKYGRSVAIRTSDGSTNTWEFDKDGVLTIPTNGDIVDADGNSVLGGGGGGNVSTETKYYVCANVDGNIQTSMDGLTWTTATDVFNGGIQKCATNGDVIVLIGSTGMGNGPLLYTTFTGLETAVETTGTSVGPSTYTDNVVWNQVDYANGYFVAVGKAQDPANSNIAPIIAYSTNGIAWTYANVDFPSILTALSNANQGYTYSGNLFASDVVYNGSGWAISFSDGNTTSANGLGGLYITDITSLINDVNFFWMADMTRIIWTGSGWIGWNTEEYGSGYLAAIDPRVGMFDGPLYPFGDAYTAWLDGDTGAAEPAETAGGKIGDTSYAVWSTGSGQIIWTTNFGQTWNFSVPLPTGNNNKTGTYLDALTFAGDKFYASNDDEQIFYSTDLITWTKVDDQNNAFEYANDLAYCVKVTSSVAYDRLVKGDYSIILNADGQLELPANSNSDDVIGVIQSSNGYPTLLAYGTEHGGPEFVWTNSPDVAQLYNGANIRHSMWINGSGLTISLNANENNDTRWSFNPDGTADFPDQINMNGNAVATTANITTAINALAAVASTGSYNDLTDRPTGGSTFSGSYTDLTNKPTIPTLTSQLTNDSGFLTSAPTNITGNAGTVTNGVYTNTTQIISGIKSFTSQLNVNTASGIATNQSTFPLVNTTATTVNFAGAATTINIGADTGTTTIYNNLHVAGDITFTGTSTTLSATNLDVTDSLIYLATNNAADILDIGWVGAYIQSSTHKHTGLVRDASDGKWKLFSGVTTEPTTTVDFTSATYDTLKANIEGNITGNAGTVTDGFYTTSSFYLGTSSIAVNRASGAQTLNGVSISGNAGTVTNGVYTTGSYSDPTWITSLAASKISGSIGVAIGGTGVSTITGYIKGNGTSAFTGSTTIPNTDITGLGTISTQGADSVTITGGSVTGLSEVGVAGGTITVTNNSSSSAVKITQTGTGNALLIEDSASTDSTPFVIDKDGNVGIGTATASMKATVVGAGDLITARTADTNFSQLVLGSSAGSYTYLKSNNGGTGTTLPLAIITGSTEALRVDTSQRVLVGQTAVSGSVGNSLLYVTQGVTASNTGATIGYFQTYNSNATTDLKTWRWGGDSSGNFVLQSINDSYATATEKFRIDNSTGNVGIGQSSATAKLDILQSTDNNGFRVQVTNASFASTALVISADRNTVNSTFNAISYYNATAGVTRFRVTDGGDIYTSATGAVTGKWYSDSAGIQIGTTSNHYLGLNANNSEKVRVTTDGKVLIGTTSYATATSGVGLQVTSGMNDNNSIFLSNTATSPYGPWIYFSGAAPNNSSQYFLLCQDSSANRAVIMANGGLKNYSANNVNLSDEREKKSIQLAGNYLDKLCQIPVKTFLFNDQSDEQLNLGVIAQDVLAVAPELVVEENWANQNEEEKLRYSIYEADFKYAMLKAIQELKAIIDNQAAEITELKSKIT